MSDDLAEQMERAGARAIVARVKAGKPALSGQGKPPRKFTPKRPAKKAKKP